MAWVVDTCVLIDVAEADSRFGVLSAQLLDRLRPEGLLVCPMTYVELAPVFNGDEEAQQQFLGNLEVSWKELWGAADNHTALLAWNRYVTNRRAGPTPKRPLADVLIGAFALRFQGILTRNETDFSQVFPTLKIIVP